MYTLRVLPVGAPAPPVPSVTTAGNDTASADCRHDRDEEIEWPGLKSAECLEFLIRDPVFGSKGESAVEHVVNGDDIIGKAILPNREPDIAVVAKILRFARMRALRKHG